MLNCIGIYVVSEAINYDYLTNQLKQGMLPEFREYINHPSTLICSDTTIGELINDEFRHGKYIITNHNNTQLSSMSDGERKIAFLQHQISQQPKAIVIINFYKHLDTNNSFFANQLLEDFVKNGGSILQIENRKKSFLPFCEKVYTINKPYQIKSVYSMEKFQELTSVNTERLNLESVLDFYTPTAWNNQQALVSLRNIEIAYDGRKVLSKLDWDIMPGEFWHLRGKNGSGKTSLVGLITGDNPKAFGQDITVLGFKKGTGENVWQIKKNLGYYTSEMLRRFYRLDSVENIVIGGLYDSIGLYTNPTDSQKKIAKQWLEFLNLSEVKSKYFYFISPVQQRLAMVARAMIKSPLLLILDEPTAGLGDKEIELFNQMINVLAENTSCSIIYISHSDEPTLNDVKKLSLVDSENNGSVAVFG